MGLAGLLSCPETVSQSHMLSNITTWPIPQLRILRMPLWGLYKYFMLQWVHVALCWPGNKIPADIERWPQRWASVDDTHTTLRQCGAHNMCWMRTRRFGRWSFRRQ